MVVFRPRGGWFLGCGAPWLAYLVFRRFLPYSTLGMELFGPACARVVRIDKPRNEVGVVVAMIFGLREVGIWVR